MVLHLSAQFAAHFFYFHRSRTFCAFACLLKEEIACIEDEEVASKMKPKSFFGRGSPYNNTRFASNVWIMRQGRLIQEP
eukprot:12815537-Ditylum_brightwellii.AAC.1